MEILVLCDDYWHPAEVIEMGLFALENKNPSVQLSATEWGGFHFTFVKAAKDILTPAWISHYPVIMNCKSNQLNSANQTPWFDDVAEVGPAELKNYVKNGGGFLSVHAGNTSKKDDLYTDFVGNYFVSHPPRCDVRIKSSKQHPIMEGISDFVVRDEHYQIVVTADDADVFMTSSSRSGGEQIAGYTREIGKGRLCVLTPGHILDVWHAAEYQRILRNAIGWVMHKKQKCL